MNFFEMVHVCVCVWDVQHVCGWWKTSSTLKLSSSNLRRSWHSHNASGRFIICAREQNASVILRFSRIIMISSKRRVVPLIQMLFSSVHLVCCSLSCRLCVADSLVSVPQIRDDNKRQHPCLVDFSKLPETERNYNLQMSTETLK